MYLIYKLYGIRSVDIECFYLYFSFLFLIRIIAVDDIFRSLIHSSQASDQKVVGKIMGKNDGLSYSGCFVHALPLCSNIEALSPPSLSTDNLDCGEHLFQLMRPEPEKDSRAPVFNYEYYN